MADEQREPEILATIRALAATMGDDLDAVITVAYAEKNRCQFCGFLLKASDTFCCPERGWKV